MYWIADCQVIWWYLTQSMHLCPEHVSPIHSLSPWPSLTLWGQDKLDNILQTTFSNAFSWMKKIKISLKFVLKGFHWKYSSIGSDKGLASTKRQAIIWTNDGIVYWPIYASLCRNGTKKRGLKPSISFQFPFKIPPFDCTLPSHYITVQLYIISRYHTHDCSDKVRTDIRVLFWKCMWAL